MSINYLLLVWAAVLAGIHPGKELTPPIDELKRERENSPRRIWRTLYTPTSIGIRASPAIFLWHDGSGRDVRHLLCLGRRARFMQHSKMEANIKCKIQTHT
jgi:hypothetical protein